MYVTLDVKQTDGRYKKTYSVVLQLITNCVQNKAGSRKKPNRLFTLAHLSEKFLDVTVELLGQTQSFCKLCLWEQ